MKKLLLLLSLSLSLAVNAQVPNCTTQVAPADLATNVVVNVTNNSVPLSWTLPVGGTAATGIKIKFGPNIAAPLPVLGTLAATSTGVNITGLLSNTTYYWQALATNATGDAVGCTPYFTFTTQTFTNAPDCTIGALYPTATYTVPVCNGVAVNTIVTDAYAGEYARVNVVAGNTYTFETSNFADYIKIATNPVAPAVPVIVAQGAGSVVYTPAASGVIRYYIHTDEFCGSQDTNRARTVVCITPALAVESFDGSVNISVTPNPANNFITVSSKNASISNIEMTDINGRVVKTVKTGNVNEANINISELSSGVYMLKITSENGVAIKKIMKN